MKIHYLISIVSLCCCLSLHAQTNDMQARESYLEAEAHYRVRNYHQSADALNKAEQLLGSTNLKIAYLKALTYAELAKADATVLPKAITEIDAYLSLQTSLHPVHEEHVAEITQLKEQLPAVVREQERARALQLAYQREFEWKSKAKKLRVGVALSLPAAEWYGATFGSFLGRRASLFEFSLNMQSGKLTDEEFKSKIYAESKDLPAGKELKQTSMALGYYQGIRLLPRYIDFIRPVIGARFLIQNTHSLNYSYTSTSGGTAKSTAVRQDIIKAMRDLKLNPAEVYDEKLANKYSVALDLYLGAMVHLKGVTLMAGKDLVHSKSTVLGAAICFDRSVWN